MYISVNNLPKVVTQLCSEYDLNPRFVDHKSDAVAPPQDFIKSKKKIKMYVDHKLPLVVTESCNAPVTD